MGQDPSAIREEIAQTRNEMGETVEAIGYKADVKSRAKEKVSDRVDSLKSKVSGTTSDVSDRAPSGEDVKQGAQRAAGVAQENPLGLAIGAAAFGFLAGMLVPSTNIEDEHLGPVADQVKEKAKETGQEALDRGRQVAQEAAESAKETVQEEGQKHAQQMSESGAPSA